MIIAISCLVTGADSVLGPANITKDDHIPIEQCISTCKLRPGSGFLSVKVLADGPTRVLRINDSLLQVKKSCLSVCLSVCLCLSVRLPSHPCALGIISVL